MYKKWREKIEISAIFICSKICYTIYILTNAKIKENLIVSEYKQYFEQADS